MPDHRPTIPNHRPEAAQAARPLANYVTKPELNGNTHLDRQKAIEYLVDAAVNAEEWEWVGCKALLNLRGQATVKDLTSAIGEVATGTGTAVDPAMVNEISKRLRTNYATWPKVP